MPISQSQFAHSRDAPRDSIKVRARQPARRRLAPPPALPDPPSGAPPDGAPPAPPNVTSSGSVNPREDDSPMSALHPTSAEDCLQAISSFREFDRSSPITASDGFWEDVAVSGEGLDLWSSSDEGVMADMDELLF